MSTTDYEWQQRQKIMSRDWGELHRASEKRRGFSFWSPRTNQSTARGAGTRVERGGWRPERRL